MRFLEPTFALLALPTAILAVSLSDFTPRVSNLPSSCETVYTQQISGCSASDFASPSCSKGCIEALDSFTSKVKTACGNEGIEDGNIISTFLEGNGPSGLCTNADAVLGGGSESTASASTSAAATTKAPASTTSSSSASSTSSEETTSSATTSSSSAVLSGTATATSLASSSSASDSSSGILVDTSSVPSATSTSSSSGNAQTNLNDNSGGGSPFDTEGNMNSLAAISTCSLTTVLFTTAMILFATLR